jgi:hypothetical protein
MREIRIYVFKLDRNAEHTKSPRVLQVLPEGVKVLLPCR